MKKKFFVCLVSSATVMTLLCLLGTNEGEKSSDLSLANVEALAAGENSGGKNCYNTITSKDGAKVRYCPTCSFIDGTDPWYAFSSKC